MDAASQLVPLAERRRISLIVEPPDNLPQVIADASRIAQVLMNLLSHAIKSCVHGQAVQVTTQQLENRLRITVAYDGGDLSDTQLRLILHPTSPSHNSATGDAMQNTLGLLIARRIVEAHGSTLRASRAENRTTFSFDLKVCP
jgi:signal transduction histidine kinase